MNTKINDTIKQRRINCNKTQQQIANGIKRTAAYVGQLEKNQYPTFKTLLKLKSLLKINNVDFNKLTADIVLEKTNKIREKYKLPPK